MVLEELTYFGELPLSIALIVAMIVTGKWIIQKSFEQVESANRTLKENSEKNNAFMQDIFTKHTEKLESIKMSLSEMEICIRQHVGQKDDALELIKERDKTINELFEMLKQQIKDK